MEATIKKIVSERRSRGIGGKVCTHCHSNTDGYSKYCCMVCI